MSLKLCVLLSMLTAVFLPHTGGAQVLSMETRQEIAAFLDTTARKEVPFGPSPLQPIATKDACTIMRYSENNLSAGVAYGGDYKTCVLGFPFEALRTAAERENLMNTIMTFFNNK